MFTYLALAENRQFFAIKTLYMTKCTHELYNVYLFGMILKITGEQIRLLV